MTVVDDNLTASSLVTLKQQKRSPLEKDEPVGNVNVTFEEAVLKLTIYPPESRFNIFITSSACPLDLPNISLVFLSMYLNHAAGHK